MLALSIFLLCLLIHFNITSPSSTAPEATVISSLLLPTIVVLVIATGTALYVRCPYGATHRSGIPRLISSLLPTSPTTPTIKSIQIILSYIKDNPIHQNSLELSSIESRNKAHDTLTNDTINEQHNTAPNVTVRPSKRHPSLTKVTQPPRTPRHVPTHLPLNDISGSPAAGINCVVM